MSRRQMQLGELNLGLTGDELTRIGKMTDLRTRPAKSTQDENIQISRLLNNEVILQKIIKAYGDLGSAGGRAAIGVVFGVHKQTIDRFMGMRRTGAAALDVAIDPALFAAPLAYVAEAKLPATLGLSVTKAVDEATTDPKASTFTVNHIVPTGVVAESTFQVTVNRYAPGQTQLRVFKWSSLDTPEIVCAKWKSTMEPSVLYAGKYIGSFDPSTQWGTFVSSFYYEIARYVTSDNPGDVIVRTNNGESFNVADSLELLSSELILSKKSITILSCTATADSWLITTDNVYTPFQVIATPAYNPTTINALNKISPPFASSSTINSDPNWPVTAGWRATSSSYYQNNALFLPFKAFDRIDSTYWASAELAYTAAGVGSSWI
ncbi:hypothetical protein T492DRAFT_1146491 [Pavlovales sp. CCMP2436]|nr:hypothetical protein T492DRAFT_1146491 [Pavlovales sp. CCMP2436]